MTKMTDNFDFPVEGFQIGPPKVEEAESVGELFYKDMQDLRVDVSEEEMTELARNVAKACQKEEPRCVCWVARETESGNLAGLVLANFHWSVKFGGAALWIEELYVDPEYRRNGIGGNLVKVVLQYAEANGIKGIDLEAYQGNTPASVLYRTMGFHRLGRERFYYDMTEE